jgi:hypothetical protein
MRLGIAVVFSACRFGVPGIAQTIRFEHGNLKPGLPRWSIGLVSTI